MSALPTHSLLRRSEPPPASALAPPPCPGLMLPSPPRPGRGRPTSSSVCPLPMASHSDENKIQAGPSPRRPPGPREPSLAPDTSLTQLGGARRLTATPSPLRWGLYMTDSGSHSGHAASSVAFPDHPAEGHLPTLLLSTRPCLHRRISCPSWDRRFGAAVLSTMVPAHSRCRGTTWGPTAVAVGPASCPCCHMPDGRRASGN